MKKSEQLLIRIAPDVKAMLKRLADADGRSMANYLEMLIKRESEEKEG